LFDLVVFILLYYTRGFGQKILLEISHFEDGILLLKFMMGAKSPSIHRYL